jgi:serine/threonine-protein kinase
MAEVLRGWQLGTNGFARSVAIKRIRPELARRDYFRAQFHGEALIMTRLSHPNIVAALDLVNDNGEMFLVLEHVEGVDLAKLIAKGPVSPSVALFIAAEVLSGLGYAHHLPDNGSYALGIVHRDLSPRNILLSWDGAVKLADFGIAGLRIETQVSGEVQGVARYMSPEQRRGEPLDGRADLFSLGAVVWELLTGEPLRAAEEQGMTGARLRDRLRRRPGDVLAMPRDLERVVRKLLRVRRERRYSTAGAALDAISKCQAASSLRARAELVELLARRFPAEAARRSPRRPPPLTRTPALPPPVGVRPMSLRQRYKRHSWRIRRRRWELQRDRARRLAYRPRLGVAAAALGVLLLLGLVAHMAGW